jgi:hypothetical protein
MSITHREGKNSMTRILETLISLDRLHCHFEGDSVGDGEPYLWTAFFKIDGDTIVVCKCAAPTTRSFTKTCSF